MKIISAKFVKGVVGEDKVLNTPIPQLAFIGRSNVGKSTIINALTGQKKLSKTSSSPGRTREINLFLINNSIYLIDLPGYGYAKLPQEMKNRIKGLINWYLFLSDYQQKKIFLIIDAKVGPTKDDLEMLIALEEHNKEIVIIANKIDKVKSSEKDKQVKKIKDLTNGHKIILCSAKNNLGISEIIKEIF